MAGMEVPEWADEMRGKMADMMNDAPDQVSYAVRKMTPITSFSNLFAEYEVRDDDVLLHLFPRNGSGDTWEEGRYLNRCNSCRKEVPMPEKISELKPCPACGHSGLVYVPGRAEEKATVAFPSEFRDYIEKAVDETWMGDVAIELVPELGAYAIQFQRAKTTASVVGIEKFVDKICEALDGRLER